MGIYDGAAQRALAAIAKKGAPVLFPGAIAGTAGHYDEATDTTTPGSAATDATLRAVQIEGDPDRFQALKLILSNPVTLLIAAKDASITPAPGMAMIWAGTKYTVRDVEPLAPDGNAIIWTVIGSAG
jgi:hypothetical protein